MTPRLAISQLCPPSSSSRKSRLTIQDPALGKHLLISMRYSALWLLFLSFVCNLAQSIPWKEVSHDVHACHHLIRNLRSCIAAQVLQSCPALPHQRKPIACSACLVCNIMGPTCMLRENFARICTMPSSTKGIHQNGQGAMVAESGSSL